MVGDRYGGEWPRERFRVHGIQYDLSEHPKSDLYGAMLPLLNAGRAELLDLPRLAAQLIGLERKTARSGRTASIMRPVAMTIFATLQLAHCCSPMPTSP